MIEFRDRYTKELGELIVHRNEESAARTAQNPFVLGTQKCCGLLKTKSLLDRALSDGGFTGRVSAAHGVTKKSLARKERIYSFRDAHGQWDPKNQRPELWNIFNSRIDKGESIRVFPPVELDRNSTSGFTSMPKTFRSFPLYYAKETRGLWSGGGSLVLIYSKDQLLFPAKRQKLVKWPDAFAWMHALHRRRSARKQQPVPENHRRDGYVSGRLRTRKTARIDHDERRLDGIEKKREGLLLMGGCSHNLGA